MCLDGKENDLLLSLCSVHSSRIVCGHFKSNPKRSSVPCCRRRLIGRCILKTEQPRLASRLSWLILPGVPCVLCSDRVLFTHKCVPWHNGTYTHTHISCIPMQGFQQKIFLLWPNSNSTKSSTGRKGAQLHIVGVLWAPPSLQPCLSSHSHLSSQAPLFNF